MKKTFIFLSSIAIWFTASAQSVARTSLYEEFSGENYGIWFPTNPLLHNLLTTTSNSALVVPITWAAPLPSAPSLTWSLYQTNKAEINWRCRSSSGTTVLALPGTLGYGYPSQNTSTSVATNGINSGFTGRLDGQHPWTFGAASDDPGDINSSVISSAQTQTTNFRVYMIPNWSPTFTNCVMSVTVESVTSFTAVGNLMFRLCLVERVISFATPPGINGEKTFYDVVRQSYPTTIVSGSVTSMGVALTNTWFPTQTQTFTVNCNIPSYIKDPSQMAFVGFVQDDGDRKVYQALRTAQPTIPNDIKAAGINIPLSCTGYFTPIVTAQNLGPTAVTALTIAPYIDGIAQPTFNYSGSIPALSSSTLALPNYSVANGSHAFSVNITGVSGGDMNLVNNTFKQAFGVSNIFTTNISEPFTTFPPANWYVLNYDFEPATWNIGSAGGFGASPTSTKFDLWNYLGWGVQYDDLVLPAMNLTGISNVMLSFDVAYAQYTNQNDKLEFMVSTDCGMSWTTVYSKSGSTLSTAPAVSVTAFVPNATQWRTETINLSMLDNTPLVLAKFVATSDFGNNLYVDNVNLGAPVSVKKQEAEFLKFDVFPNPTAGSTVLSIDLQKNERIEIKVMNSLGQVIYLANNDLHSGANKVVLNSETWVAGTYFVKVGTVTRKIIKE
jgi:hypothetical protein